MYLYITIDTHTYHFVLSYHISLHCLLTLYSSRIIITIATFYHHVL